MKRSFFFAIGLASLFNQQLFCAVPQLLNLQGRLTDKQGMPLSGDYSVKFSLWSTSTGTAGGAAWGETQNVKAERGVFGVLLGSVNPIPADVFTGVDFRYLEIDIESPVNDPPMTPRQRLVTVAYAFLAEEANHAKQADSATSVPDNSITTPKIADGAVIPQKLSSDALYSDQKAVKAVDDSGKFLKVSTEPATLGQLILPSTSPVISASSPDGKITLANDTQVTGTLKIGENTVTIGTTIENTDEILFTTVPGFITGQSNPLTIRTTQGPNDINLTPSGNLFLNPGGAGTVNINRDVNLTGTTPEIATTGNNNLTLTPVGGTLTIDGTNVSITGANPVIQSQGGNTLTINSNGGLNLNNAGVGAVTVGNVNTPGIALNAPAINLTGANPAVATQVGNTLTLNSDTGLNLNSVNNAPVTTGTGLFTTGADVRINGNDIQDSAGTTRITVGTDNTLTGNVNLTGNLNVNGTGISTIGGDLRINGNDIQDSNGTSQLSFDSANNRSIINNDLSINGNDVLDSNGTARITFDTINNQVEFTGQIVGDGSGLTGVAATIGNDSILSQHINDADGTTGQDTTMGFGIKTAHIQDGAVTSAKINDGAVATADIADNVVTNAKMADNAINTAEIQDNAVTSAKIAANTIVAGDIAAGTITGTEIADSAITNAKITGPISVANGGTGLTTISGTAGGNLLRVNASATGFEIWAPNYLTQIADNAVTNAKMADDAVTSVEIADGTIADADISATAAIAPAKISGTAWTSTNDGAASGLDADTLDGQQGTFYQNASNVNAGTLATDRYSAQADLTAEGLLNNDADTDILTRGQANTLYAQPANVVQLQGTTPGTQQTGNLSLSGTGLFGGNVGIGTTNSVRKLNLFEQTPGNNFIRFTRGNETTGVYGGIEFAGSNNDVQFGLLAGTAIFALEFKTPAGISMVINQYGNVGIGTTNPGSKLHIENNGNTRITLKDSSNTSSKYFQIEQDKDLISFNDAGTKQIMNMNLTSGNVGIGTLNPTRGLLDVHAPSGDGMFYSVPDDALKLSGIQSARSDGDIYIHPNTGRNVYVGQGNELAVINNKVGIGTLNPAAKLDISVNDNSTNGLNIITTALGARPFYVESGSQYGSYFIQKAGVNLTSGEAVFTANAQGFGDAAHFLGGNVGVGTTNPSEKLEVAGNVKIKSNTDIPNAGLTLENEKGSIKNLRYSWKYCPGPYGVGQHVIDVPEQDNGDVWIIPIGFDWDPGGPSGSLTGISVSAGSLGYELGKRVTKNSLVLNVFGPASSVDNIYIYYLVANK